jgi:hypothetical protein
MANKSTFAVDYKVVNTDPGTDAPVVTKSIDKRVRDGKIAVATSFMQSLGFALDDLWMFVAGNGQYKSCTIEVGGVKIPEKFVRILKNPSRANFEMSFAVLRDYVAGEIAVLNKETGVKFLRETDRAGHFQSVKDESVTSEIIAAQVIERRKMVAFATKLVKEDAKSSVWPPELLERQKQITERRKAERKLLKAAK